MDPRNDGAFVTAGIAFRRAGDVYSCDSAITTRRFGLNPRAADAFNNRGNAFRTRQRARTRSARLRRGDSAGPALRARDSTTGASSCSSCGEVNRAISDFNRAIAGRQRPTPTLSVTAASRGYKQRFVDLAIADFDEAFRIESGDRSRHRVPHLRCRAATWYCLFFFFFFFFLYIKKKKKKKKKKKFFFFFFPLKSIKGRQSRVLSKGADDNAFLPEPAFELLSKTTPPFVIEVFESSLQKMTMSSRVVSPVSSFQTPRAGARM